MSKLFLILICLLFLLTRLYKIADIPPSVYWDEASIGVNAYSILKTGKDEWGEVLPLHFRAFGEFKLPVYIYTVVPFIQLFGLNEFSIRIPSVLFSLGVVVLTYFLAKKLFENELIGLFSAFFVTISPQFFIFSRSGFEVSAGLMFFLLGIYLFLRSHPKGVNVKFMLLALLSFIIASYSYNSFRILAPATFFILILMEKDSVIQQIKRSVLWIIASFVILLLAAWPIFKLYIFDTGTSRFQVVAESSIQIVVKNYLSHFDPLYLFIQGDNNLRHQQLGFGQLYLPELILIIAGLLFVLRSRKRFKWLPIIFICLAPIPAAITKESPHALRSLSMAPFIHIVSAGGIYYLTQVFKKKILISLIISIIFLIFFVNYFMNFVTIYPHQAASYWQAGYKKIFTNLKFQFKDEGKIYISEKEGQPYIFALFYLTYDPEKFRREVVRNSVDKWGFSTVKKFGKFEFGDYK